MDDKSVIRYISGEANQGDISFTLLDYNLVSYHTSNISFDEIFSNNSRLAKVLPNTGEN